MRIDVVTIFPQMFKAVEDCGMSRVAIERGHLELGLWDPRDYAEDNYRRIDDRPYGGGPGMVMQAPQLSRALRAAKLEADGKVVYLSPQGQTLTQEKVRELAGGPALVLLTGRYEGIDQRVLDAEVDEEISIGE